MTVDLQHIERGLQRIANSIDRIAVVNDPQAAMQFAQSTSAPQATALLAPIADVLPDRLAWQLSKGMQPTMAPMNHLAVGQVRAAVGQALASVQTISAVGGLEHVVAKGGLDGIDGAREIYSAAVRGDVVNQLHTATSGVGDVESSLSAGWAHDLGDLDEFTPAPPQTTRSWLKDLFVSIRATDHLPEDASDEAVDAAFAAQPRLERMGARAGNLRTASSTAHESLRRLGVPKQHPVMRRLEDSVEANLASNDQGLIEAVLDIDRTATASQLETILQPLRDARELIRHGELQTDVANIRLMSSTLRARSIAAGLEAGRGTAPRVDPAASVADQLRAGGDVLTAARGLVQGMEQQRELSDEIPYLWTRTEPLQQELRSLLGEHLPALDAAVRDADPATADALRALGTELTSITSMGSDPTVKRARALLATIDDLHGRLAELRNGG